MPYRDYPASWPGIFFRSSSKDNEFNYAVIKNAYQALGLEGLASNDPIPKLTLNECIIDNAYEAGIITVNSSVTAQNCLISNCGKNVAIYKGGDYSFTHCTMATYSNSFQLHKDPSLILSNYVTVNNVQQPAALNATFKNCIIWGENGLVEDEVVTAKNINAGFIVNFESVLWKVTATPANVTTTGFAKNANPQFDSIDVSEKYYDFRIATKQSPAVNAGATTPIALDLDGKPRTVDIKPDLGCFEKQ